MRESKLQDKCIEYLKDQGIYYINMHGSGWGSKGSPDLVTCIDGRFVAFELKVGANAMEPAQRLHKRRIERSEGLHYCPRTLDEFIKIINKKGKQNNGQR